ncbi:MAG TPA: MASE1 domain-containing protein [Methylomirabilota bacterium]|nr:MASE1 domain-containing protein [Methylomirabilota bacterium]
MKAPAVRIAATALLVAGAYYVGANIGFILRFPPATPSVMWPPNAVLTAVLLLTPPRRWWIYLVAAFPAHLVAELGADWPVSLVLMLFVTNCSEALLAAVGVRWFGEGPARFDTLRRVTVFIAAAVLLAPFLSSFLDAAAVTTLQGEPYWVVWRTRFVSNALTELTLVPAIVTFVTLGRGWVRQATRRRQAEAAVLAFALMTVGIVNFAGPFAGLGAIPGAPVTPLAYLLPFLLWAGVRFGPGGASLALLGTALIAIWAATHARGPFIHLPLAESVVALQLFLTIVAVPLLCLAALIEERGRAQEALRERLSFEELLARLSGAFVHLPGHAIDSAIEAWLQRLGEFLGLDRITIRRFSADGQALTVSHSWTAPPSQPAPLIVVGRDLPWSVRRLHEEQPVVFARPYDLPDDSVLDRDWFRRAGIRSGLILPMVGGGRVFGSLAFFAIAAERSWPEELVQRLRLVAEVFASSLARQEAENALRASELMKSAILASLSNSVAVLDREGRVLAVNENWTRFACRPGAWDAQAGLGISYLEACRQAAREGVAYAAEALEGIKAVLDRSRPIFVLEYRQGGPGADPWFAMSVVPLDRPEGGAVVSHTDVTERKRIELDAQRSRQELAHFTRVSTMGELTASLAHELNQPLTGILANAQAARRYLDASPPDLVEVQEILGDIIEDDKRAAEVIQRLRDFLRKGESQQIPLDLNAVIRDVAKLVSSDAVIRNVTLTLALDPDLPIVIGDRVQLQQVILNLLINGMEAMGENGGEERPLVVRTECTEAKGAHVFVQDAGPGLRSGTQELIFEPFYTTKPAGMGMGLAIARSIIEAHEGAIWAVNNPTRGAAFHFTLPGPGERAA